MVNGKNQWLGKEEYLYLGKWASLMQNRNNGRESAVNRALDGSTYPS